VKIAGIIFNGAATFVQPTLRGGKFGLSFVQVDVRYNIAMAEPYPPHFHKSALTNLPESQHMLDVFDYPNCGKLVLVWTKAT
jgi:hypothetical protein